jgi:hypothetical protein
VKEKPTVKYSIVWSLEGDCITKLEKPESGIILKDLIWT